MSDTPTTPTTTPTTPAARRIFTATLILGVPGAGKTSLLATFAEYLWETFNKVLLLYSWDGGAIPTDVQKLMKHGVIRFWRARTRSGAGRTGADSWIKSGAVFRLPHKKSGAAFRLPLGAPLRSASPFREPGNSEAVTSSDRDDPRVDVDIGVDGRGAGSGSTAT